MSVIDLASWRKLQTRVGKITKTNLKELFENNPERFENFSIEFDDILFDYSKNLIDEKSLKALFELAEEAKLKEAIEKMFSGEKINFTENRAVLHIALRNISGDAPIYINDENVKGLVKSVLERMKEFVNKVHSGEWKGFGGKRITDVVNIGIGGSDLGPRMVVEALKPYAAEGINTHFVSNVDSTDIAETLKELDPETTLFIIASKSFSTQETLTNAKTAREWFLEESGAGENAVAKHFVALSTNEKDVKAFGIDLNNMFEFWDWVGGRYSLWSAIGLSIALSIGYDNFERLLIGAEKMDEHFRSAPFERNIPVILGLLGIWYNNFFGANSYAVVPYDQYLDKIPAFLQQLEMESNGKRIDRDGKAVDYATSPVIWGEPGTNAQHSFFQALHQGTQLIPVDFIASINPQNPIGDHRDILLSNFFAQPEALMKGKTEEEVRKELKDQGLGEEEINKLAPHKVFPGNRPSNSILIDKLNPEALGSLIAMYEHKVFVQGTIWNINPFDQWGVELGKKLAKSILPSLLNDEKVKDKDSSTSGLINYYLEKRIRR